MGAGIGANGMRQEDVCTVILDGYLEFSNQQDTRERLYPLTLFRYGVIDLRRARMADATFLSSLASLYKAHAEMDGQIARFNELFAILPNMQEAYRLIGSRLSSSLSAAAN